MTVGDLIEVLREFDEDADVRIASQPNWPFEYEIDEVIEARTGSDETTVYLGEGIQIGYLPGIAAVELGWRERPDETG
jgi:hypothetical protein